MLGKFRIKIENFNQLWTSTGTHGYTNIDGVECGLVSVDDELTLKCTNYIDVAFVQGILLESEFVIVYNKTKREKPSSFLKVIIT